MACTYRQFSGRLPANDPLRRGLSFNLLESYHSNLELSIRKVCVSGKNVFLRCTPHRCKRTGKIPSPEGKVAPKGSEEEYGQISENSYNSSDLHKCPLQDLPPEQVFRWVVIVSCRPHSSSVMEIAFGDFHDSFPPGEAIMVLRTIYSLLRMILPEMVLGSSPRNSTMRGYL